MHVVGWSGGQGERSPVVGDERREEMGGGAWAAMMGGWRAACSGRIWSAEPEDCAGIQSPQDAPGISGTAQAQTGEGIQRRYGERRRSGDEGG